MTSEIRTNTIKNRVGLGTVSYTNTGIVVSGIVTANSFSGPLTSNGDITGTGNLTLTSTDAGSSAAPIINLFRNSASPADADYLGQIKFAGESDTGVERNYAKITGKILDASNGTEDGIIEFAHIKAGSQNISARFRSDSLQLLNGTALTVAGTSTFNGDITGAAGVDLNLDSTLGSGANTAFSGFDGRLVFDTSFSDTARGPNKIQLQNTGGWVGGFGISSNTLDIYTGGITAFRRSTNTNTYSTQLTIDHLGNLSPSGDVRLSASAGDNSSLNSANAAWGRLEFDQDYNDSARGPNKILLTPYVNWKAGFGISSNSLDVYTGGIIHFYGKTNTDDAANKETLAKFITDGAVELYHDNSKKFETTSTGADVTGNLRFNNADSLIHTSADTSRIRLFGGSTNSTTNGAALALHGVNHSSGNYAVLAAGNGGFIRFSTGTTERLKITSDGYVGISESSPHAGLTVGKLGDYPTNDGNTYYVPVGKWSTSWNSTNAIVDNTDYWVGYTGGYLKNGSSVNISLAPNRGNTNNQCGMYISGEATGIVSADFTLGKIIGGSATGRGTSGNVRATKSELLRITSGGNLSLGNSNAAKKVHISTTGNQKILIDPNYNNNSGGSSNSEANANNIVESILIRTSFGDNAASQTNAGHKWGIKFQGYNGNDFTQATSKCAGVFAVSEDEAGGYNRNVGLTFHTSPYNTNHREVMRINTNGIVTKPYQYVFTVSTGNHQKTANWSKITNHAPVASLCTGVSDGTNWSNSTQRFTAPVAGVYHFFVGGWSYGNSNGSRYAYAFRHTNGNNLTFIGGGDYCSGDSPMVGWSRTIKLAKDEWVELWGYSAIAVQWGGGHVFYWGGYLLG